MITVLLVCAHLSRTAVLLALAYLALRRSKPPERTEILQALGPVLGAVGSPGPKAPALPADQGGVVTAESAQAMDGEAIAVPSQPKTAQRPP
jgi:hypothetical protein